MNTDAAKVNWYYTDGFERCGPVDENTLIRMYLTNEIGDDTYVWNGKADKREWINFKDTSAYAEIAKIPSLNTAANNKSTEQPYPIGKIKSPLAALLAYGLVWVLVVLSLLFIGLALYPSAVDGWLEPARVMFILYLAAYVGMWTTYFRSGGNEPSDHYLTLRRLLLNNSMQWHKGMSGFISKTLVLSEREQMYQNKASSGNTALSMLVAAALLELVSAHTIYSSVSGLDKTTIAYQWPVVMLGLAVLCALVSFISFIIAVDALESLFNRFKHHSVSQVLLKHFYAMAVNPRYYGFAFLIAGAVLLIASQFVILGVIAFGLVFVVGYAHWFPGEKLREHYGEANRWVIKPFWIRVGLVLTPPAILLCFI